MPTDQASGPRAPVKVVYVDVAERLAGLPALAATAAYSWALVFFQRGARVVGHAYVDLRAAGPDELSRRLAAAAPAGSAVPVELVAAGADAAPLGPLPRVSVVIPSTLDRLEPLRRTLRSLVAQRHQDFEAIVVDNRPDGTPERAAAHEELRIDPRVRVVEEAMPGISAARNRGIASATADIIAFTDDDVEAAPDWLGALAGRFAREPDTDCVTGLVLPAELETAPQIWFECSGGKIDQRYQAMTYRVDRDASRFAAVGRDHTGSPTDVTPLYRAKFGMGANMAFRTRALTALGGFELALGAGTASRGGEDIVMISRLLYDGRALTFDPAVVVRHYHRRQIGELRSQMRGYGVGYTAALLALIRDDPRHVLGILAMLRGAGQVAGERSNQRVAADFPASLSRTEVIGLATGPFAYARSVWGNRASVARKAGAALLPAATIAMRTEIPIGTARNDLG